MSRSISLPPARKDEEVKFLTMNESIEHLRQAADEFLRRFAASIRLDSLIEKMK